MSHPSGAFAWQTITSPNQPPRVPPRRPRPSHSAGLAAPRGLIKIGLTFTYDEVAVRRAARVRSARASAGACHEASGDLGAKGWTTLRKVVWPLALPGIVAGSIFSFSLTLGDYIAPIVGRATPSHRQRDLRQRRCREQPPVRCGVRDAGRSRSGRESAVARKLGVFEALRGRGRSRPEARRSPRRSARWSRSCSCTCRSSRW